VTPPPEYSSAMATLPLLPLASHMIVGLTVEAA
jgi:hypothetical protein